MRIRVVLGLLRQGQGDTFRSHKGAYRSAVKGVRRTRRTLTKFEQRFGVATTIFLQDMAAEDLAGGDLEYVERAV